MKSYPSIPRSFQEFDAYVFDKLDGRNVRVEWSKKTGFFKYGSRTRLFDKTDKAFGPFIDKFMSEWSDNLSKIFVDNKFEKAVSFFEYWGPTTIGGIQNPDETYSATNITLIDVAPHKQGLFGPKEFLKFFSHLEIPAYLGNYRWTRGFVESVRNNQIPGITLEGVVGKSGNGKHHDLIMAKAKTQRWIDIIIARYGQEEGTKLVNS